MDYKFVKVNDEPIAIEFVPDEHDEEKDLHPSFWFENRRRYLEEFARTQTPWTIMDVPDYIHGYEADNYWNPLFIEIINDSEINLYREEEL